MRRHRVGICLFVVSLGIAGFAVTEVYQLPTIRLPKNNVTAEAPAVIPPTPGLDLQLRIVEATYDGKFTIEMTNTSEKTIRVWRTGNSWGEMNWRVFHLSKGGAETFFESPIQMFTKNTPSSVAIEPKSHITRKLDLNGGNWCGRRHCSWFDERGLGGKRVAFDPGDMVVVSYDVRSSNESFQQGVWVGVTAATGITR